MQKLSTTLIAVLALACAAAEPVFADDRQDIEAAVTRFEQAVNAGDAAAIAAMYTEDAALMRPGALIVQGRDKVGEFWKSMLGMGMTNFDIIRRKSWLPATMPSKSALSATAKMSKARENISRFGKRLMTGPGACAETYGMRHDAGIAAFAIRSSIRENKRPRG